MTCVEVKVRRSWVQGYTYPRLEVDQDCARNVVLVVGLIKEHVFAIAAFSRPFLQNAFIVDAVLGAQALPIDRAHYMNTSAFS
jgi:hypothetical protein